MSPSLQTAIADFRVQHPEYATPEGAFDKCREASALFCDLLEARGIPCFVDEYSVVNGIAHKAAVAEGLWIDWTARQFDSSAAFPAIEKEGCK